MAKVIKEETIQAQVISPIYSAWRITAVGAALGAVYWGLTALIDYFIITPVFCRSAGNTTVCLNSVSVSGDIATILVAVIGIAIMIRLRIMQPLIIAVASAAVLWGLGGWTNGLAWGEIVAWSALLYGLAYLLFSWIARYNRIVPVLVYIVAIILIIRIMLVL
ncbi:MAG TPA: hypothetical protein PLZ58_02270 [Candidatus Saccharibacteria bacterium]|nr:hypothetical protein [Candidatus Saccharibacteria bacterium]HRN97249.1 hypothetical protein [Candidatus Saccharibacteria bacterium]HRQ06601.1 hypothetical protein [Candidatus Saccharibacteria bacterium]